MLTKRLRCVCEEADLLAWYFARHCPGDADEAVSASCSELIAALAAARGNETDEKSCRALMEAYPKLGWFTYSTCEVHGRSIRYTLRRPQGWPAFLVDRRILPMVRGVVFFLSALALRVLDAWTKPVPSKSASAGEAGSTEVLCATLLAPCIPPLSPVARGVLGACAAPGKRISDGPSSMSCEDNRMRALTARILLGAALALVLDVLVFVEGDGTGSESVSESGFGLVAAAFLAGLFVQHIHDALETFMRRISRAISPDEQRIPAPPDLLSAPGGSSAAATSRPQPRAGGGNPATAQEGPRMRNALWIFAAVALWAAPAAGQSPEAFAKSKRLLAGVREGIGHLKTVYPGYFMKGAPPVSFICCDSIS